eukprot:1153411-Pelagomonas_calceolata.AAC.1
MAPIQSTSSRHPHNALEHLRARFHMITDPRTNAFLNQDVQIVKVLVRADFAFEPASDQLESWAVGQPLLLFQLTFLFWFASPLYPVSAEAGPYKVPRYLNSDLGRHVQRHISRFRQRTPTMGVERACWQTGVNGHFFVVDGIGVGPDGLRGCLGCQQSRDNLHA